MWLRRERGCLFHLSYLDLTLNRQVVQDSKFVQLYSDVGATV